MHVSISEVTYAIDSNYCLKSTSPLAEAVQLFLDFHLDALPVIGDDGTLIGVFSKYSLYRAFLQGKSLNDTIESTFKKDIVKISLNDKLSDTSTRVKNTPVGQWVVVDDSNKPVGMLTKDKVVRFLLEQKDFLTAELSAIVDAIPSGLIAVDKKGIIKRFNPAVERLIKYPCKSAEGLPLKEIIPELDLDNVINSGHPQLLHKQELRGKTVIFGAYPIVQDGEISGAVGIFQDITDFERVSDELENVRSLHRTLQTILENVNDGVVVTDGQGFITMVNPSCLELLNNNVPESVVGKKFKEVFKSKLVDSVLKNAKADIDTVSINGKLAMMSASPIKERESESIAGTVTTIVFRNLTKIKNLISKLSLLEDQVDFYRKELSRATASKYSFNSIITCNKKMLALKEEAASAAMGYSNILLIGESGTGKELFAHAIHAASARKDGPFVRVNCAAIPENLMESELFGYEDGAFTGARKGGKPGKFELADGGTIFLDEIGDMPLSLQAKILRVLQEKEFERIGGTKTIRVNVRVISATNKDLYDMLNKNQFRQDLFFRLNVITLYIPPLRERKDDILYIAKYYIEKFNRTFGKEVKTLSPKASRILENYNWPGNVRELTNVIERAMNMNVQDIIDVTHLPPYLVEKYHGSAYNWDIFALPEPYDQISDYRKALKLFEKTMIVKALDQANGKCSVAAKMLGISRSRLYEKMVEYSITPLERAPRRYYNDKR
jgi:PAS domain S-box-containing protein